MVVERSAVCCGDWIGLWVLPCVPSDEEVVEELFEWMRIGEELLFRISMGFVRSPPSPTAAHGARTHPSTARHQLR